MTVSRSAKALIPKLFLIVTPKTELCVYTNPPTACKIWLIISGNYNNYNFYIAIFIFPQKTI